MADDKEKTRIKSPKSTKVPRMDIRTIAQMANVSIATVSRTINRKPTVNPVIAKRVWKVIDQLEYFPDAHARGLVSGKSRLLV